MSTLTYLGDSPTTVEVRITAERTQIIPSISDVCLFSATHVTAHITNNYVRWLYINYQLDALIIIYS